METVYIETSIVSYLRQRRSAQIVTAARQIITQRWWDDKRQNYQLVLSQFVIDEASAGNPELAAQRLEALEGIPRLPYAAEVAEIATDIMSRAILPDNAEVDALHIAAVAHHRIQYLLTWNCKHIANANILRRIHNLLSDRNIPIPIICTPEELLGDDPEISG
jgi:predicted nucleic acid-binding protein